MKFRIYGYAVVEYDELDHDDQEEYAKIRQGMVIEAEDEEKALDIFHETQPIACLEDWEINVEPPPEPGESTAPIVTQPEFNCPNCGGNVLLTITGRAEMSRRMVRVERDSKSVVVMTFPVLADAPMQNRYFCNYCHYLLRGVPGNDMVPVSSSAELSDWLERHS